MQVGGIDHLSVAVSDLARSVAFYDPVMRLLGFRKGRRPIAGEPHVHYFTPQLQSDPPGARPSVAVELTMGQHEPA